MSTDGLRYRPALDGLRALAVLAVFLYHAREPWMPGGWFGVDVFFVLSGFLITTILLREHWERGWISLARFWTARARRLLPALALVLLSVLVANLFLIIPSRRQAVATDALAALFYVANWRFLTSDEAYFATLAAPSPLRHTWSLAVEEQYYLVFPLLLTGLLLISRRRSWLAAALSGLAVVSAAWMAYLFVPGIEASRVYYGTDTRVFELFVGAALAALMAPGQTERGLVRRRVLDRVCRALAIPALVFVVALFAYASDLQDGLLQGGMIVAATIVGILVLAAASPIDSPVQRLLSLGPLRLLGLISYGFYLWHWPVVVFVNSELLGVSGWPLVLLQLLLTLALATASYRLVEVRVRQKGMARLIPGSRRASLVVAWGTVPAIIALVLAVPTVEKEFASQVATTSQGDVQLPVIPYTAPRAPLRAMFVGNSIPLSLAVTFPDNTYPGLHIELSTSAHCVPYDAERVISGRVAPQTRDCLTWRSAWPRNITSTQSDLAVIWLSQASLASYRIDGRDARLGDPAVDAYLQSQWGAWTAAARRSGASQVVFVNLACHQVPDFGNNDEVTRTNDTALVSQLNTLLAQWAAKNDIAVIDQYSALCTPSYRPTIGGVQLYSDAYHFTERSGPLVWKWLAPQLVDLASRNG